MLKYIHNMQTSDDINEKTKYLSDHENDITTNTGWMLKKIEELSKLLSHCNCHECGEFIQDAGSEEQTSWVAVGESLLCVKCFKDIHL